MSWAEVKKVNSDLEVPLNIVDLLNTIDTIGTMYTCSVAYAEELLLLDVTAEHTIATAVLTDIANG